MLNVFSSLSHCVLRQIYIAFCQDVFDANLVESMRKSVMKKMEDMRPSSKWSDRVHSPDFGERGDGRWEVSLPSIQPFTDSRFLEAPGMIPVVQAALATTELEVDTLSAVISLPQSGQQHWHRDASRIFAGTVHARHLRPHALVIVAPLVDVSTELGPTQFVLGSHLDCDTKAKVGLELPGTLKREECGFANRLWQPKELMIGTALLFDLRILHGGGANKSNKMRPVLYVGVTKRWYRDPVNFNLKQTRDFDTYTPRQKMLLSRQDSKLYTMRLEELLIKNGFKREVAALQSTYNFHRVHMKPKARSPRVQ